MLEYVDVYKYLGVMINNVNNDDDEINMRMRGIYASGNMIIRKFGKCSIDCKIMMFRAFMGNIYASGLWSVYKVASYSKIKVSHNDIFRSLLNVPRWESATTLFTTNHVDNLDCVIRKSYYSLMTRVRCSTNPIVASLVRCEARVYSSLWHHWGLALGRDLLEVL